MYYLQVTVQCLFGNCVSSGSSNCTEMQQKVINLFYEFTDYTNRRKVTTIGRHRAAFSLRSTLLRASGTKNQFAPTSNRSPILGDLPTTVVVHEIIVERLVRR